MKAKEAPMPTSDKMPIPQHVLEPVKEHKSLTITNNNSSSSSDAPFKDSVCPAPHDVVLALCTCIQHPHQRAMEIDSLTVQEYQMRAETERKQAAGLREQVSKLRKANAALEEELKKDKKQIKVLEHNAHLAELDQELFQDDLEDDFDLYEEQRSVDKAELAALREKNASLKKDLIQALNDSAEYQQRAEYAEQQLRENRGFAKIPNRPSRFIYDRKTRDLPKSDNRFGLYVTRSPKEKENAKIAVGDFVILDPKTKQQREQDGFWLGKVLYVSRQKGNLTVDYYVQSSVDGKYWRSEQGCDHGVAVVRKSVLAFATEEPPTWTPKDVNGLKQFVITKCRT
jgi:hypothetical protein